MPPNKYLPAPDNGSKLILTSNHRVTMAASRKNTDIEISASLIPTCLQVGVGLGVDPVRLQHWTENLDLDSLETGRIDYTQVVNLIELIQQQSGRTDIAFLLGETFGFHFSPAVSTYLGSLDSLRTLLPDIDLVKDFFCRQFDILVESFESIVRVRLMLREQNLNSPDKSAEQLAICGVLAFCQKLMTTLLGSESVIDSFHFREGIPTNVSDHERYLKGELHFNCDFNGFQAQLHWLDLPLRGALPSLNSKARKHMQAIVSPLHSVSTLSDKILLAFSENHRLVCLPMAMTAEHFNISERTLQRKLHAEEITFFELQEQAKKNIAGALLKEGLSTDAVAERLGFSDRRSFCRAFKRWFGVTPSMYRTRNCHPCPRSEFFSDR